jgi:hypothetical protein
MAESKNGPGRVPDCDLSFVVTTRNDNHGGDMLRRFKLFVDSLLEQANRHGLRGELIIVEWNPPSGPRLHDVLTFSNQSDWFAIRFLEVPAEAHRAIRNADVIPLFQMIAKNVGIRRAKGKFVVATNPDLLFSDALISFLASRKLDHNFMYRIDRHDVPAAVPDGGSTINQLAWCEANVLRVHRKRGTFPPRSRIFLALRRLNPIAWIRALAKSYKKAKLRQWSWAYIGLNLINIALSSIKRLFANKSHIFFGSRHLARRLLWGALRFTDPLPKVHTNGCGDFTLMSKERWLALRGYPELPIWSMHVDSLLCYMAVASGLRERVLRSPAKVYHIEHYDSWVVLTPDEKLRTFAKRPWIDTGLLDELWGSMYRSHRSVRFNDENWGLAHWPLEEIVVISGQKHFVREDQTMLGLAGVG